MFVGHTEIITSLYGMKIEADPTYENKLQAAIEYLGDKYLLAKPVEKSDERFR